ncbi:unnamed protein product [Kluyveromyces dobzhanskii CBS 2104]|uniref:WGS project CCBQ000000000 data, contig 00102 n=1 Tax=Kluyveromyces dobzhanskii CBS 2104 TaxID=1427455 RepID=A0A0A8L6T2_9SACH|nr:unnamed protein product [Kluyveromyces dobzhanskii CBS 2104]
MIASVSYQIISVETLKPVWKEAKKRTIDSTHSLQSVLQGFETDVLDTVGEEDFVLCSLNSTWDLRVTQPRQARDESWLLPSFLQHPKVFDLWREVDRWFRNHPDLHESCSELASGGVNTAQRTKPSKLMKNTDELLGFLNIDLDKSKSLPSQPVIDKDSFEQLPSISQCEKILLTLHKNCTSDSDLLLILTHPYDSYLDIKSFLSEKSTVLYMNNLPPDTTQSELESWFSQFGSRPVGFWTVKNVVEDTSNVNNNWSTNNNLYVDEQDSISGFAVFQKHEEALDSLTLNGRSILSNMSNTKQPRVVEHVVEIQPSSDSVLDRAQEILTPFPQSKNKPRPGDWTCPSCSFSNFQRRTACFRCSFPMSSTAQASKGYTYNKSSSGNGYKSRTTTPQTADDNDNAEGQQQQQQQQQQQHLLLSSLSGQLTSASSQDLTQKMKLQMADTANRRFNHPNRNQQLQNQYQSPHQQQQQMHNQHQQQGPVPNGSNVPFRAGDWKCANCTYHNFAKNVVCLRCGGPKTSATAGAVNQTTVTKPLAHDNQSATTPLQNSSVYLQNGRVDLYNVPQASASGYAPEQVNSQTFNGLSLNGRSSSEPNWNSNAAGRA